MQEWLNGSRYIGLRPASALTQLRELNSVTLNMKAARSYETSEKNYYSKLRNNLKDYPFYS